jgi:hypothetical protein
VSNPYLRSICTMHEQAWVAMAHGHAKIEGKPMASMVHTACRLSIRTATADAILGKQERLSSRINGTAHSLSRVFRPAARPRLRDGGHVPKPERLTAPGLALRRPATDDFPRRRRRRRPHTRHVTFRKIRSLGAETKSGGP